MKYYLAIKRNEVIPQKFRYRVTTWLSNSTSEDIPRRNESRDSHRYLHTHGHSSIIPKSPKVEATPKSTEG